MHALNQFLGGAGLSFLLFLLASILMFLRARDYCDLRMYEKRLQKQIDKLHTRWSTEVLTASHHGIKSSPLTTPSSSSPAVAEGSAGSD
jgi:hypothetical protein